MRTALAISLVIHLVGAGALLLVRAPRIVDGRAPVATIHVEVMEHDPSSPKQASATSIVPSPSSSRAALPARLAAKTGLRGTPPPRLALPPPEPHTWTRMSTNEPTGDLKPSGVVGSQAAPSSFIQPAIVGTAEPPSDQATPTFFAKASQRADEPRWGKIGEAVRRQVVYPSLARRRGMQGRTTVKFVVERSGEANEVRIVESSGFAILDNAALEAIARATPLPAPAAPTQVVMPIVFTLR